MAFMLVNRKGYKGPYPCYEGEFCGNYNPEHAVSLAALERAFGGENFQRLKRSKPLPSKQYDSSGWDGESLMEDGDGSIDLEFYRLGRPRDCEAGTSAEMAAQGWRGLYLRRDVKPFSDGHAPVDGPLEYVPTPDSLREPSPAAMSPRLALFVLLAIIVALMVAVSV